MDIRPASLVFLLGLLGAPASAQSLRGRAVDEPSRTGLRDVDITIENLTGVSIARATTDTTGFFFVELPTSGSFVVRASRFGYEETRQTVRVTSGAMSIMPALVLKPNVIALDSIEVVAGRRAKSGFSRSMYQMNGARLASLELHGAYLEDALREMPGIRMHRTRGDLCIESPRRVLTFQAGQPSDLGSCNMIVVVLDGHELLDAGMWLSGMTVDMFESIEYKPPVEAGFRYGLAASAVGALVLWSRGKGPLVDPLRNAR